MRVLAFLGLIVPTVTGSLVGAFGAKFAGLGAVLTIGGLVAAFQIGWSLWALVAKWDSALTYAWESQVENVRLSKRFQELADTPPPDPEFGVRMRVLVAENDAREAQDGRQEISDEEKRAGHRAALRHFRRPCTGCNTVPTSLDSTNCSICGRF